MDKEQQKTLVTVLIEVGKFTTGGLVIGYFVAPQPISSLRGSPEITRHGSALAPFTLRQAQGERVGAQMVEYFPFVLSLSKHGFAFR